MDLSGPIILAKVLTDKELAEIPEDVKEKLNKYLEEMFDKFFVTKAVGETSKNSLDEVRLNCESQVAELKSQTEDLELKLKNSQLSISELRNQLDNISTERANLLEQTNKYECDLTDLRRDKNAVVDERESLLKVVERQNTELERLQQEIKTCQQQLRTAINTKCEALARVDEIESKEASLDFKEKRMEQERLILTNQIQRLSEDLNRNIAELQNIRRENTMKNMHLETKLVETVEELKIAHSQCAQYKDSIDRLTLNSQELSSKMLAQSEESNKMMEYYKKELEAKSKLAEIYKSNCDDSAMESNELGSAIADLKRMLGEASEQYGELETKLKSISLKHEQEIDEKNKIIESQKAEILHANELLKEVQNETMENALNKLAPSAAVASRLIKSDMTLTELYSLYVKTTEENEHQKRENNRLNLQMKSILHELEERAPILKKQELEFEKLVETRNLLAQQLEEMIAKKTDYEQKIEDANTKISHLERENKKLKYSQSDLSRQVCFLLKEIEQNRSGFSSENNPSLTGNLTTTDEIISKKLVTFNGITELQENNQKLLLLVRDLSSKLEESESIKNEISENTYQQKIENYTRKIRAMQESLQNQTKMLNTYMTKSERYKKMYFDAFTTNEILYSNGAKNHIDQSELEERVTNANTSTTTNCTNKEKRHTVLEKQLHELKEQLKTQKEQHEYYMIEKKNHEKILNEQFDSMRTEVRELTSTNCKLMSSVEYNKEHIKIQQKNIATYKQQISALEDRNKNYENTIIKHEQSILFLKDEIMKSQKDLSSTEAEVNHLRQENRLLKDSAARLQSEKEGFHRERQNQNLLLNNLEMIKVSFERSEMEGRVRLETRLDETCRELSAQRRRCQEEQDRFRELASELKRQADTAKERMEEEKVLADKVRKELIILRNELATKSCQIDELSKKLQESLAPTQNDNPIVLANKKAKEFELKLEEVRLENNSLVIELAKAKEHAEQYCKMSQCAESEIKNIYDLNTKLKAKTENELKELKAREMTMKSRIEELETEIQLQAVTESQIQISGAKKPQQLHQVQEELKDALQKLNESNRELRAIRSEYNSISVSLNAVEQKYANEMVLHSADIQQLTKLKSELTQIREQTTKLSNERDNAIMTFEENKTAYSETVRMLQTEKEELENRLTDLDAQNSSLHNQIEALTTKLTVVSSSGHLNQSTNESMNEIFDINRSISEEECKNNEQLLQIIKFLRKEKDISVAKVDILKAENIRLISEHTILQKKIDELSGFLNQERSKSETVVVTATRHEEILRKIETLNAITDSNRILREERDLLAVRVKELHDRISKIEDELIPLQKQNRELSTRIEEYATENNSLKTEAIKWRQRANLLIEKSNKNPEEFRRLQCERENLAKMLTTEKDQLKQVNDELNIMRSEKSKLETELANFGRQLQVLNEEKKKILDDFNTVKLTNTRLTQEIMELKNKLLQKEEELQKNNDEMESKESQLQDSKNKEIQIRKIAKRYKDSFLELSNKMANANSEGGNSSSATQDNMELVSISMGNSNEVTAASQAMTSTIGYAQIKDVEKELRNTIESLNKAIKTTQEENEKIRKENEDLKIAVEKDERGKVLLREAKTRIMSLTESKNAVTQELATTKTKLQSCKQSTEDHDAIINGIKNQYEETLGRMEKELVEQNNHSKEMVSRLTRENESLLMRINQLSRQLGLQQAAKPSTSSGTMSDKSNISESSSPRTANVKPMSGSSGQQSATVTPWRGGDTPLASIRPISVQNSRTAAILPTSQTSNMNVVQGSSSSSGGSNTALVPPQQQVHTTGSNVDSMSPSPTSSHTDYMPSTSSAAIAVAAVPPMGTVPAAESSQEAESVPLQNNESQVIASAGQPQAVALVSPRVEGSMQSPPTPAVQSQQEINNQPSTSGTTSSSHVSISSHSRHASSSSNVTTTQATSGHKRPRDIEGDSSTGTEECGDKSKSTKRTRMQLQTGEGIGSQVGVSESGVDVEYQVPTSSQRDQEDDIIVVDSEEDDGMADEGNAEADVPIEDGENDGYEDSYEQDQDMDEIECPIDESNIQTDNNEVEVVDCLEVTEQCIPDNQIVASDASTSQTVKRPPNRRSSVEPDQDNNQQSQAISSGSSEPIQNLTQPSATWKQASSLSRQQKATLMMLQQGIIEGEGEDSIPQLVAASNISESCADMGSPHGSKFVFPDATVHSDGDEAKATDDLVDEDVAAGEVFITENYSDKKIDETGTSDESKKSSSSTTMAPNLHPEDSDGVIPEEPAASLEVLENDDSESHHSNGATQSEIPEIQQNQIEGTAEDVECVDGVSSEGEKATIEEEVEEEGREAEASTSPSINTRSKSTRGNLTSRRPSRGYQRVGRPTPIIWQDHAGNPRNTSPNQRNQDQPGSPSRTFQTHRAQRARRMRRPGGSNYGNMRYS